MKLRLRSMYKKYGKDDNHRCKDCCHLINYSGYFYKCKAYGITLSEDSDWECRYIACGMFNKALETTPVTQTVQVSKRSSKECEPIDGQMTLQ